MQLLKELCILISGGGQRRLTSLYYNNGGSRKTISSAYCNIGGSRKQIYPYYTETVYQYKIYDVTSWTEKSISGCGSIYDTIWEDDFRTSYSFKSSTGVFTCSGTVPSSYKTYYESGAIEFSTTVYYPINDYLIVSTRNYDTCGSCGNGMINVIYAYYAYPAGHSSSYSIESYTYAKYSGYTGKYCCNYYSSYWDCPNCTGASSEEVIPMYWHEYIEAV